MNCVIYNKHKS